MNLTNISYKDSGIAWIGQIPEQWKLQKLKSVILKLKNGVWGDDIKGNSNDIVCIRVADFDSNNFGVDDNNLTYRNIIDYEKNLLETGDLILEKSGGGDLQLVGRVIIFNKEFVAVTSNFLATIKTNKNLINNYYLYYLLRYYYSVNINYKSIKQTTGIQNLDSDSYLQEQIPLPPLPAQTTIANYLDTKTTQISDFITKKKQIISLLQEQKQAIIHQAVTKGIDSSAKMKDSGIAWIGEIPENWEARRLKTVCKNIQTGSTPKDPDKNPAFLNGTIPWYGPSDFNDTLILPNQTLKMINKNFINDGDINIYPEKTVFVIGIGATLGKIGLSEVLSTSNQQLNAIIFSNKVFPRFGLYFLNATQDIIRNLANSATLPILNQTQTKNLFFFLPPLEEQQQIVSYIESRTSKIDQAIAKIEQEISLIEEYRTSLIYHAVTGKINIQ